MTKSKKFIVANWKMNPVDIKDAKKIFVNIKKKASKISGIQTIICPPFIYLEELISMYRGRRIDFGAQDAFSKNLGSFTGMISPKMLKENGVEYVILGHSERRVLGETDEIINNKTRMSLKTGLTVILCIGEKMRNSDGWHFAFVKDQLLNGLEKIGKSDLKNIMIAYEPVWAISNNSGSKSMDPADVQEMTIFIKKVLTDKYGVGVKLPKIIYGGSVSPKNTKELFEKGGVDGLLVGKASLDSDKFNEILSVADSI